MSLKQVFKTRAERAARALDDPEAGPKKIFFSSTDLSVPESLDRLHEQFPREQEGVIYLYQLSLVGRGIGLASRARMAFRKARAAQTRNLSRDNEGHPNSGSLYVGKCKCMYDRFRTHLGKGEGKTTWSLYLSAWAVPLKTNFVVEYYEFTEAISEDVELIEGVLWDSLQPLFGKKGGR